MPAPGQTFAVVPVKDLANVKQRLSSILDSEQRQKLVSAMVKDVLCCLRECEDIEETWVITDDPAVELLAAECGAKIKAEPADQGLIQAVTWAAGQMALEGVFRMIFLPGDVPLVTTDELNIMLQEPKTEETATREFIIAPARDLGGSNCVCCIPPDCMRFGFGIDSFRRHLRIADDLGVDTRVIKLPGLGLDVDTPDDLRELIIRLKRSNIDNFTRRYLDESGLIDRLDFRAETS